MDNCSKFSEHFPNVSNIFGMFAWNGGQYSEMVLKNASLRLEKMEKGSRWCSETVNETLRH
jgi:hypothetical protein